MFTIVRQGYTYTERKVFVKHTTLIDKCKNKRKNHVKLSVLLSQKINETCKNYFEKGKPENNIIF